MGTLRKAQRPPASGFETSRLELSALPARLLTQLPLETRILAQATGTKTQFILTTALDAPVQGTALERRKACWLAASELDALILGVEEERTFASDLVGFALRKLHDRSFRVTEEHVLGGAFARGERPARTLGEVLAVLDLEIVGIELGPIDERKSDESTPARAA